jgi:hypothetical protein
VTIRTGETVVSRYMLTAGAFTAQLPRVSDGVYTVTLTQTDEAGNVGVASQTVLVDATPPVIDHAAIAHHYFLGATVPTPAAICRDDLSGIASCDAPATLDTSAPGFRTIAVTAVDRAGNRISGSVSYWVGRPPGPRLAIVSATAHRRGHVITVRARGTIGPGVIRPLLVAAGGHRVSVPVADGAWRATIRLRSHARKVVLKLVYDGDATHRAGRGHRTIRVR